jgi:hypothetical protein
MPHLGKYDERLDVPISSKDMEKLTRRARRLKISVASLIRLIIRTL